MSSGRLRAELEAYDRDQKHRRQLDREQARQNERDVTEPPLFTGPEACKLAGVTYRQLDYWARIKVLEPTCAARGSGSQRGYTFDDVLALAVVQSFSGGSRGRGTQPPFGALAAVRSGGEVLCVVAGDSRPSVRAIDADENLRTVIRDVIALTFVDLTVIREQVVARFEKLDSDLARRVLSAA